jgi:hypothetical protein
MPAPATSATTVGYDSAVKRALEKLTSEIFIFIIGYTALLAALIATGTRIPNRLEQLIVLLPLVGIVAYAWLRKRTVIRDPSARGVRLKALFVKDSTIVGVQGPGAAAADLQNVDVQVGFAVRGEVAGVNSGADRTPAATDAAYLLDLFNGLTNDGKRKLISSALGMKSEERARHG